MTSNRERPLSLQERTPHVAPVQRYLCASAHPSHLISLIGISSNEGPHGPRAADPADNQQSLSTTTGETATSQNRRAVPQGADPVGLAVQRFPPDWQSSACGYGLVVSGRTPKEPDGCLVGGGPVGTWRQATCGVSRAGRPGKGRAGDSSPPSGAIPTSNDHPSRRRHPMIQCLYGLLVRTSTLFSWMG